MQVNLRDSRMMAVEDLYNQAEAVRDNQVDLHDNRAEVDLHDSLEVDLDSLEVVLLEY